MAHYQRPALFSDAGQQTWHSALQRYGFLCNLLILKLRGVGTMQLGLHTVERMQNR